MYAQTRIRTADAGLETLLGEQNMSGKINVSTSTNICTHILWDWDRDYYTSEEAIRMIAAGGFDSIDLDFAF